jgi:hypothetical protein
MSSIRRMIKDHQPEEQKNKNTNCAAHGCPLPGSISPSAYTTENSLWFCRFHFGEPAEKWPQITASIRSGSAISREESAKKQHRKDLLKEFGIDES